MAQQDGDKALLKSQRCKVRAGLHLGDGERRPKPNQTIFP